MLNLVSKCIRRALLQSPTPRRFRHLASSMSALADATAGDAANAAASAFTVHVCDVPSSSSPSTRDIGKVGKAVACLADLDGVRAAARSIDSVEEDAAEDGGFGLARIYGPALTTRELGRTLLYAPRVDSTQRVLHHLSKPVAALVDTACVADTQTAGKGRGDNIWSSPPGCLLFSFNFASTDGTRLPFAQYLISLALIKAVRSLGGCHDLQVKIKWPNDIYAKVRPGHDVEGVVAGDAPPLSEGCGEGEGEPPFVAPPRHGDYLKIGGVLCQSSYDYQSKSFVVVAGIGLNVLNDRPTTCLERLRKSGDHRGGGGGGGGGGSGGSGGSGGDDDAVSRAAVLAAFFNIAEPMLDRFHVDGFDPFRDEYLMNWLHTGQMVTAVDLARGGQAQKDMPADGTALEIVGIAASSGLLALDRITGQQYELLPDGNSLDFMQGLLKRKL
jgi:biotin--protein ligase